MLKMFTMIGTTLIGLGLTAFLPVQRPDGPPPPHDAKKKEPGAAGDLRKAYDAIRWLPLDEGRGGPPEERLRDWAGRAAEFYRKGVRAMDDRDERLAHEYGTMAHDLARATDHAINVARSGPATTCRLLRGTLPRTPESGRFTTSAMRMTTFERSRSKARRLRPNSTSMRLATSTAPPDATPRKATTIEPASWPAPPRRCLTFPST